MDLENIILSDVSQTEKNKTEIDSQTENKLMVPKGEREWGRDKLRVWD